MKNNVLVIAVALALGLAMPVMAVTTPALAQDAVPSFRDTALKLPRFAALQGEKTYVRSGPGLKYPIKWIFKKRGLPVEIVQEFDGWRKIRDWEGGEGWVHQSLLSGNRTALIQSDMMVPLRRSASLDARMIARLEPMVVVSIEECTPAWCRVATQGFRGWAQRNFLWGIYEDEEFN